MPDLDLLKGKYLFDNIPELTDEEKKSEYAWLYYLPMPELDEDIINSLRPDCCLAEDYYFSPNNLNALFGDEERLSTSGWLIINDRFSMFHVKVKLQRSERVRSAADVLFGNDPVGYKAWMPGFHTSHAGNAMEDLGWGNTSVQIGDKLLLDSIDPEIMTQHDHFFSDVRGNSNTITDCFGDNLSFKSMLLKFDEIKNDELYTHCVGWLGLELKDNKYYDVPVGESIDIQSRTRYLALHCAIESARRYQIMTVKQ